MVIGKTINIMDLNEGEQVIAEIPTLICANTMYPEEEPESIEVFGTYTYVECCIDEIYDHPFEWFVWIPKNYDDYGVFRNWITIKAKRCGCKGYDTDKLYIDDYQYGMMTMMPIRFCEWDDRMAYVNAFVKRCLNKHITDINNAVAEYLGLSDKTIQCEYEYFSMIENMIGISDEETSSLMPFYGFKTWIDIYNKNDLLEYDKRTARKYIKERERQFA